MGKVTAQPDGCKLTEFDEDPGLRPLQEAVGGLIQIVPDFPEYGGRRVDVVVDEEGLLKRKPLNVVMTQAWRQLLDRSGRPYDLHMARLYGDAAVVYGGIK